LHARWKGTCRVPGITLAAITGRISRITRRISGLQHIPRRFAERSIAGGSLELARIGKGVAAPRPGTSGSDRVYKVGPEKLPRVSSICTDGAPIWSDHDRRAVGLHTGFPHPFLPPSNAFPPIARCSPRSSLPRTSRSPGQPSIRRSADLLASHRLADPRLRSFTFHPNHGVKAAPTHQWISVRRVLCGTNPTGVGTLRIDRTDQNGFGNYREHPNDTRIYPDSRASLPIGGIAQECGLVGMLSAARAATLRTCN
jgi:hypothetical protein